MSRFLTFRLETKLPWRQTPPRKKKSIEFTTVTANAYQSQINVGVSKWCEKFKVCGIESLKNVREFHTPVCYCGEISTPLNMTLHKTNCDWFFDMSVQRPHGRALTNEHGHLFQTFSRRLHTSAQPIARVWGVATVAGWARGCFFVEKEIQISLQKCRPKFKDLPKYKNTQKQIRYAKRKVKSIPNMLDLLQKAAHFTWLDKPFYFHRYRWTV